MLLANNINFSKVSKGFNLLINKQSFMQSIDNSIIIKRFYFNPSLVLTGSKYVWRFVSSTEGQAIIGLVINFCSKGRIAALFSRLSLTGGTVEAVKTVTTSIDHEQVGNLLNSSLRTIRPQGLFEQAVNTNTTVADIASTIHKVAEVASSAPIPDPVTVGIGVAAAATASTVGGGTASTTAAASTFGAKLLAPLKLFGFGAGALGQLITENDIAFGICALLTVPLLLWVGYKCFPDKSNALEAAVLAADKNPNLIEGARGIWDVLKGLTFIQCYVFLIGPVALGTTGAYYVTKGTCNLTYALVVNPFIKGPVIVVPKESLVDNIV